MGFFFLAYCIILCTNLHDMQTIFSISILKNIAHFTFRESTKFTIYRIFVLIACPYQQKVHDFWILPNCLSADPGVEVLLRVLFRLGV